MSAERVSTKPRKVVIPVKIPDEDRALFKQKRWEPFAANVEKLEQNGLITTDRKLFIHGMFIEWDAKHATTYRDFARDMPDYRPQYDKYVNVEQASISYLRIPRGDMAERMGVGGALSIATQIADITDADFRKIPETSLSKTFDYEIELKALGPDYEFEIEAKGIHDGKGLAARIKNIRDKKEGLPKRRKVIRLGCVVDIATTSDRETTITLVDPPEDDVPTDHRHERLMNRLQFYLNRLLLLTPNGRMTIALANRIQDLRQPQSNWQALDGSALVGADLNRLPVDRLPGRRLAAPRPLRSVHVRAYPIDESEEDDRVLCYIHGLTQKVLKVLIVQNHNELLELRVDSPFIEVNAGWIEGDLEVLPSGVVGGLAYVDRSIFGRSEDREDDTPTTRQRR